MTKSIVPFWLSVLCILLSACVNSFNPRGESAAFHINPARAALASAGCANEVIEQTNFLLLWTTDDEKAKAQFLSEPKVQDCYYTYLDQYIARANSDEALQSAQRKLSAAGAANFFSQAQYTGLSEKLEEVATEHNRITAEERRKNELIRAEQHRKNEEARSLFLAQLVEAERKAVFRCRDKSQCDKAFSLTQIYIDSVTDMKLQIATDTILETHNPNEDGKIGLKAWRIPGRGTSAEIRITIFCHSGKNHADTCSRRKFDAYRGFIPFIKDKLL